MTGNGADSSGKKPQVWGATKRAAQRFAGKDVLCGTAGKHY